MASSEVHLRPMTDADLAFLRTLYGTTRAGEMAMLAWDQATLETFLEQQFQAQHSHYQAHYAGAAFSIIESAGEAIGRAYLLWTDSHLHIIDTALMPAWRGRGIGTGLIRQWLARADRHGLSAGLHVTPHNPALRLYQRNGFETIEDNGLYLKMRRPALAVVHIDRPA
ncbi:N-acetyltransferase [Pseudomonas sp. AFG_SD02_1510_Pfu_092]|uniref:GNAT family N-acetyltransferase n=1 Tax=Pseudomonas sp. AFG_SD02_1510_Pfu_092 TaxID=2259497 RepID=UPI000DEFB28D|nr:GNAT family N-acetyltransferase [Pseudomonas sp. AFG_SD02_1510_Pfu_092]RCL21029.1 N-acetyltransferase [Pseudomonas sp. AFG_SD02_1510_Pfu_092]